jgi:hypothetical protein
MNNARKIFAARGFRNASPRAKKRMRWGRCVAITKASKNELGWLLAKMSTAFAAGAERTSTRIRPQYKCSAALTLALSATYIRVHSARPCSKDDEPPRLKTPDSGLVFVDAVPLW